MLTPWELRRQPEPEPLPEPGTEKAEGEVWDPNACPERGPAVPQLSPARDMFGGAPRFLAYPRTFTVQRGADALLKCQITGDPCPTVSWEKDKAPLEPLGRCQVRAEGELHSLSISRASPADSGQYVCKAQNAVGETYAAATLQVQVEGPRQEGAPGDVLPAFLVKPLSVQVCRGEDVVLTCRVAGQPCPVLAWEKDGRKLSGLFESGRVCVGQEPGDWHFLKLFGARPPDGGVYVCRARNRAGEALAAAVLLVDPGTHGPAAGPILGPPGSCPPLSHLRKKDPAGERRPRCRQPPGPGSAPWPARHDGELAPSAPRAKVFAVREGKHAKFRCCVTGRPKPESVWQKAGKVVAPDRRHLVYEDREGYFTLKVLYCRAQDQGLYTCTASNAAGQTLSAVQLHVREHRVRFQVPLADVEVQERQDAVLECQVPLETIPTAWYLEDKPLRPSHKYVIEEQGLVRRLTVRDARADDDGIYLCEMKEKGRSVAELAVRGAIVKRLPRKLDVMEGENAAFCVETQEAVEGICWSRNGLELRETPCTVLKSFGKTHLLVLVHVTREDAGVVSFAVGESQTSAQLRVKCAKRVPPSAPVAAEMSAGCSNAALVTWCPGPDARRGPPSSYVLERQEASTAEWVPCLTTDLASMVEVPGESVPVEADYCFRVWAVNQYGRSRPVEFPGSVHLVPAACVRRALADVQVQAGEDARFSLELSASVRGQWLLNGAALAEEAAGQRYCIEHSGTQHSLLIRGVQPAESGAQLRFLASGVQDSATLRVQAPQVRIARLPEAQRLREVAAGLPVLLQCEVSPPETPARWLKEGQPVPAGGGVAVQAEGCARRLLIRVAGPADSGTYTCEAGEEAVSFALTVTEPPVRVVSSNEEAAHTYLAAERVVLACELSRADAPVQWYKDGAEVEEGESLVLEREGPHRRLVLPSARPQDAGEFVCDAGGDSVFYSITVTEPPVRVVSSNEEAAHTYLAAERVVLACELSRADAPVQWYKDGAEVEEGESLVLEREGPHRRLVIPSARPQDAGEFVCDAGGDSVFYSITVTAPQVRIARLPEAQRLREVAAGLPVLLQCEVSPPETPARWLKEGQPVPAGGGVAVQAEGCARRLLIRVAGPADSGTYTCEAGEEAVSFALTVTEPPVRVVSSNEEAAHTYLAAERVVLACELSRADAPVQWYKDGAEVEEGESLVLEREGPHRRLVLPSARPQDAGEFVCDAGGDSVFYSITVTEPPVRILSPQQRCLELRVQALERLELRCELSAAHARVCWFKDGLEVDETENLLLWAEGPWRCLAVPQARAEDAGEYICETRDESVSFDVQVSAAQSPPVLKAVLGETVTLACELSRCGAPVRWLKDGARLEAAGGLVLEEEGGLRRLVIPAAGAEHSGQYVCDAAADSRTFTLQVSEPPVRILGRGELQTRRRCLAADDLLLEVTLSHAHGEVKWYKDGEKLQETGRVRLEEDGPRRSLLVLGLECEDAGEYLCDSRDDSLSFSVTVQEPPVSIVRAPGGPERQCLAAGADLVLACEVSRPRAAVRWLRDGQELVPSERVRMEARGPRRQLTILGAQPRDAGSYVCEAGSERLVTAVEVAVPRLVEVLAGLQSRTVREGDDATFKCLVSPEDVALTWQLDGRAVAPSERLRVTRNGLCHALTIRQCRPADAATVRACAEGLVSTARLSVQARAVSVRKPLLDVETVEKEAATFQLELSHEDVPGVWTRDGVRVKPGRTCRVSAAGRVHSLTLLGLTMEDSGTVTFTADALRSSARLTVREPPVTMVRAPQDVCVPEMGAASFECELSCPLATVTWEKDGTELRAGPTCRVSSLGRRRRLQLSQCRPQDAGLYTCRAGACRAAASLRVHERQVQVVQALADVRVREGENAVFTCHLSCEDVPGEWFRNGEKIKITSTVKIRHEGPRHVLLLCNVGPEDAGRIRFLAKAAASEASLEVEALPVRIVRRLRDKTGLAGHRATLECTVSQPRARVRWLRGDTELRAGEKYEIASLACYRTLVIHRLGPQDEGPYTCDALDDRCTARLLVEGRERLA